MPTSSGDTRRQFVGVLATTLLTGCTAPVGRESPEPADSNPDSERPTTSTAAPEPKAVLPESGDGWRLDTTDTVGAQPLGGVPGGGASGAYTSPEGEQFTVVVIRMNEPYDPADLAESWACIDWDVAVAYERWAFAAGTGTTQQTFTPEAPPHLDRSPVPGTETASRELLSRSPILSPASVEEHAVVCDR